MILVTGSEGFIGRNLVAALERRSDNQAVRVLTFTSRDDDATLQNHLEESDLVFHIAGANRPPKEEDLLATHRTELGLSAQPERREL